MNKRYVQTPRFNAAGISTASILALIVVMAASVSLPAHAEYRCGSPSSQTDVRACELASHDAPDQLRLFIQRTSSIYGLYFYDYVRTTDFDRWEVARREDQAPSLAAVEAGPGASKAAVSE
jgi:hypothetical protein